MDEKDPCILAGKYNDNLAADNAKIVITHHIVFSYL